MKKQLTILGAVLFPLHAATHARAQGYNSLIAEIPCNFTAGHEQTPAGKYTITHISRWPDPILVLRSEGGRDVEIVHTHRGIAAREPKQACLVFKQYGDLRFLSEMWWPGDKAGQALVKSDSEVALEKELRGGRKTKRVTVRDY